MINQVQGNICKPLFPTFPAFYLILAFISPKMEGSGENRISSNCGRNAYSLFSGFSALLSRLPILSLPIVNHLFRSTTSSMPLSSHHSLWPPSTFLSTMPSPSKTNPARSHSLKKLATFARPVWNPAIASISPCSGSRKCAILEHRFSCCQAIHMQSATIIRVKL